MSKGLKNLLFVCLMASLLALSASALPQRKLLQSSGGVSRDDFAKNTVSDGCNANPGDRFVCSAVSYHFSPDCPDAKKTTKPFFQGLTPISYDCFQIPGGSGCTFIRDGDGGFINWAFCGPNIDRTGDRQLRFTPA